MAGKAQVGTGSQGAATQPTSAYWAARLIERKRAEEALQEAYVRLRERVEEQAAHLDALSEVVRHGTAEPLEAATQRPQGELHRADGVRSSTAGWDWGARVLERERAEGALQSDLIDVSRRVEEQATEISRLEESLKQEAAARERSEADLRQVHAELERLSQHAERASAEWVATSDERERAAEVTRANCSELSQCVERQGGEIKALGEAVSREAAARERWEAALQERQAELGTGISRSVVPGENVAGWLAGWKQAEEALRATCEELGRRIDQQSTDSRSLEGALNREVAGREDSERYFRQVQEELDRQFGDYAARFDAVDGAIDRGSAERKRLEMSLEQVKAECERWGSDHGAMLRQEIAEREGVQASLERVREEMERRVGECIAELRSMSGALTREVSHCRSAQAAIQQLQADLDRRVAEHSAELKTISAASRGEVLCQTGGEVALRHTNGMAEVSTWNDRALVVDVRNDIWLPINGIIGMTDLALDTDLTAAQRDYLQRVKSLAEAVLAATKDGRPSADAGSLGRDPEPVTFKLREHLRDTLQPLLLRAHQKGIELTCHIPPRVSESVAGDPARLRQVLVNLVGNAIKFTEEGEVSVCVDTASQTTSEAVLLMTVTDSGIGIPAAQQGLLFNALAGGLEWAAQQSDATGLGLPVSSELVRAMGGRIWFESDADQGASFRFTVRLGLHGESESRPAWSLRRRAARGDASRTAPPRQPRARQVVLLAQHNPRDRSAVKQLLEQRGYSTVIVEDGRGVLAALENDAFDLVMMDLRMPGMDAFEAAAAIRALEGGNSARTPVVALCDDVTEGDRQRCLAVGIDAHVTKPIQAPKLFAAIEPLLHGAGRQDDSCTCAPTTPEQGLFLGGSSGGLP